MGVLGLAHGYLATIVGAVAATEGKLNPWMVFVSISTVHLAADNLWYFLGHLLGLGGILKYGGRIGLNHQKIDPILPEAQVYASRMLILSKLTSGMAIPVLVTVGVAHVPWRKVIAIATAGEIVRTGSILLLSYQFAVSIQGLSFWARSVALLGGFLVLVGSAYYVRRLVRLVPPTAEEIHRDGKTEGVSRK